jgi:hypothetical protein
MRQLGSTERPFESRVPAEGEALCSWKTAKPDYRIDPETGCWEWLKFKLRGYGKITPGPTGERYAYRAYYVAAYGAIPDGHDVHHKCENPGCVNPAHLEALPAKGPHSHRAKHHQAISPLSWEQVREIRAKHAAGRTGVSLAEEYGISGHCISQIVRHLSWREEMAA